GARVLGAPPGVDRMGCGAEAVRIPGADGQPLHAMGHCAVDEAWRPARWLRLHRRQSRCTWFGCRGAGDASCEVAAVPSAGAAERLVCSCPFGGNNNLSDEVAGFMKNVFSQLVMLCSSGMLLTALIVLWRKRVPAYITAYRWQAWLLAGVTAVVGYFGGDHQLYWVVGLLLLLKGIAIPALLAA